jgi:gas vesicle protein
MAKQNGLPIFVAGMSVGVAAMLLLDHQVRARLGRTLTAAQGTLKKGERTMSDVRDKVKDKIDDAADATKKAVDKVVDKSKDAAHKAGEHLERGGKRLQDA